MVIWGVFGVCVCVTDLREEYYNPKSGNDQLQKNFHGLGLP